MRKLKSVTKLNISAAGKDLSLLPADKLYADSAYFQPENMWLAARAVLEKEPKVHSTAINEMREEVKKILKSKKNENEK